MFQLVLVRSVRETSRNLARPPVDHNREREREVEHVELANERNENETQ